MQHYAIPRRYTIGGNADAPSSVEIMIGIILLQATGQMLFPGGVDQVEKTSVTPPPGFLWRLNKGLQPGRKMDRGLLHRIVPGIGDLFDLGMWIERGINAPHKILADAFVKFTE